MLDNFFQLVALSKQGQRIRRSASLIGDRPLILFHKEGTSLTPKCGYDWPSLLRQLDCGPVVELEPHEWPWSHGCAVNFNCHAMAIGSGVGVTPNDWLEGVASPATLGQNPTTLLLDRYYDQVHAGEPTKDFSFCENDVVVLYDSKNSHFIHSGIVQFVRGKLVVVSKFGEGPILLTSLELIQRFYAGKFDQIRSYRFVGSKDLDSVCPDVVVTQQTTFGESRTKPPRNRDVDQQHSAVKRPHSERRRQIRRLHAKKAKTLDAPEI